MVFRDESKVLSAKRDRKHAAEKGRTSSPPVLKSAESQLEVISSHKKSNSGFNISTKPSFPTLAVLELGTSAEDQATCFFFRNYVLDNPPLNNGSFQYLSDIYSSEEVRPALGDCVAALGMVGLSNFWKATNIMVKATLKYNSALRLISTQLRDPKQAKSDQTLVAVMLLGLYEVMSYFKPLIDNTDLARRTHAMDHSQ
jgi:hypothetical protein